MQIKTTVRYHFTPSRLAYMTAGESGECWRGCGKIGILMHCQWSCELIQPFWRTIWNFAQRAMKDCLPFDSAIALLVLYPKEIIGKMTCTNIFIAALFVHSSKSPSRMVGSIHNSTSNASMSQFYYISIIHYSPLLSFQTFCQL